MKRCPQCGRSFQDFDSFCDVDGTKLVSATDQAERTTTVIPESSGGTSTEATIECPVCGGKAQPGEVICNFCGTRLVAPDPGSNAPKRPSSFTPPPASDAAPFPHGRTGPREIGDPSFHESSGEESGTGRSIFGVLGFSIAAIIALAAGAWLALYLSSSHKPATPVAESSATPSPAPVSNAPGVQLANSIPVYVQSDRSGSPARNQDSARKAFTDNLPSLESTYKTALGSDSSLSDGMMVRLHVTPEGSVDNGSVRVSTASNPSLDAEVVRAMTGWKFPSGNVAGTTIDYPVIFAPSPSAAKPIEGNLATKLANISPNEAAEYAFAPSSASTPGAAPGAEGVGPSPAAAPPTEIASAPTPEAVPPAPETAPAPVPEASPSRPAKHRRPTEMAAVRPPKPPLGDRVTDALHSNRKLRRVEAYVSSNGVVRLYGKVFNDDDKALAARTARGVAGVTSVVNDLTTDTQVWALNQNRILQALQGAGLTEVNVRVIGSDAYLSGQVKKDLDRERAVTITQGAAPVKVRANLITVAPGSMFGF